MAWHSGKPADGDFLSASVQHIRENFAELEPLQAYVSALLSSRIVEMGSNSNGEYVRWENGLQICWRSVNLTGRAPSTQTTQSLTVYRDVYTWSFPAQFSGAPMVLAPNPRLTSAGGVITHHLATGYAGSASAISVSIIYESLKPFDAIEREALLAIGRWQ